MTGEQAEPTTVAERIENLVREVEAIGDPAARQKAESLVASVMELYGAGLMRLLEIVHESAAGDNLFSRFADDDLVSSLLVLHGLHPHDLETRIGRALDRIRPFLAAQGGRVEVVAVSSDLVRLRFEATSPGVHPPVPLLKAAIEHAVQSAAPEVAAVDVEGLQRAAAPPLIQIQGLRSAPGTPSGASGPYGK